MQQSVETIESKSILHVEALPANGDSELIIITHIVYFNVEVV